MKIIASLVLSAVMFTSVVNAQNSKVNTAATYLNQGDYGKA